jgi:methionyl aminopeptidase
LIWGAKINGYNGDNAATFAAGTCSPEAQRLMDTTRESFLRASSRLSGQQSRRYRSRGAGYCEERGYVALSRFSSATVLVKNFMKIQAYPTSVTKVVVSDCYPEMTLAIEPMINQGTYKVKQLSDGWTVVTADGKLSAHFEHTVCNN